MLKILHVNDYRSAGGCEVLMNDTVVWLRALGHVVEVFTSEDVPDYRRTATSYIDSQRCRKALFKTLRAFEPDVVHLHNFYHELSPGILATLGAWRRVRACRIVMTAHDFHLICPNSGLLRMTSRGPEPADPARLRDFSYLCTSRWDQRSTAHAVLKLLQHCYHYRWRHRQRVMDLVICPSRGLQRLLDERGFTTCHLPNPVPEHIPPPGRPEKPLRFVFAGRVDPEKGLDQFCHTLPEDFDGRMEIVGEGADLEACRATCRKRGFEDRVQFLDVMSRDEALARIAAAHVLVLPSIWPENNPMSLIEALATGTNLLVSNVSGLLEITEASGVGFVFTPGDRNSLSIALRKIRAAHDAGTLNQFDVSDFLTARSRSAYLDGLMRAYGAGAEVGAG